MKHFVRFARLSTSGAIARPGWRTRLFATSNEASAFAQKMTGKDLRVELGDLGDVEPDSPSPATAKRGLAAELIGPLERVAMDPHKGRA